MYIVMLAKVQRLSCSVKAVAIEKVLQGAFAATFLIACVAAARVRVRVRGFSRPQEQQQEVQTPRVALDRPPDAAGHLVEDD
jgi:hypothetical protein